MTQKQSKEMAQLAYKALDDKRPGISVFWIFQKSQFWQIIF